MLYSLQLEFAISHLPWSKRETSVRLSTVLIANVGFWSILNCVQLSTVSHLPCAFLATLTRNNNTMILKTWDMSPARRKMFMLMVFPIWLVIKLCLTRFNSVSLDWLTMTFGLHRFDCTCTVLWPRLWPHYAMSACARDYASSFRRPRTVHISNLPKKVPPGNGFVLVIISPKYSKKDS